MTMHKFKKQFGQNFLQNDSIINNIILSAQLNPNDNVIEIGPGLGALTQVLLKNLNKLTAIEIDKSLYPKLNNLKFAQSKLKLIPEDVLTVDFRTLGQDLHVIGNLPYNISTPLIFHLLDFRELILDMHFMLQKEVALRLSAKPGSKQFGRLSVMVQYFCEVEHLFDIAAENFYPQPKVDSTFVRLTLYKKSPYEKVNPVNLAEIVKKSFAMRRKTIANNLKPLITSEELVQLNIDPKMRPEDLTIESYVSIVKALYK